MAGMGAWPSDPPDTGNNREAWTAWLVHGGRGAGKTRAGAEWVRGIATSDPKARIALIGETEHDVREVMVEGVSGLLAVHRTDERPEWIPTRRRLEWKSGAAAQIFSAENYEGLRGPQFSAAWLDELAKWRQLSLGDRAMSAPGMLKANFTISEEAKKAIAKVRSDYDVLHPSDPAAVMVVAWGIVDPDAGPDSESVVIGFYPQSMLAEIAHGIQEVWGVELAFFTIEEYRGRFDGKILDHAAERGFYLRAP